MEERIRSRVVCIKCCLEKSNTSVKLTMLRIKFSSRGGKTLPYNLGVTG